MLTKRSQLFWNLLYKLRNGFFLQFFSKTIECHSNFAVISRVAGMLSQSSKCFTTCHTNNKKKKKRQRNQNAAQEAVRIVLSYIKWQVRPYKDERSFEEWVINRFGGRLYMHFFRTYTEKVWGISGKEIRADWAAQRIKNMSLFKVVWNAITGANDTASLIEEFQYPRLGPGMMWEKTAEQITEQIRQVVYALDGLWTEAAPGDKAPGLVVFLEDYLTLP